MLKEILGTKDTKLGGRGKGTYMTFKLSKAETYLVTPLETPAAPVGNSEGGLHLETPLFPT